MSLENTTAKYEISIVKTGTGAQQAVQEMNQVAAAATIAGNATAAKTQKLKGLEATTKTTTASLKALAPVVTLLGASAFPQLSGSILLVTSGLSSLRSAAAASGLGLAGTSAAVAGLAAGIWTAVEATNALKAAQNETLTAKAGDAFAKRMAERLKKAAIDAAEAGTLRLTEAQADTLDRIFARPNMESIGVAQDMLRGKIPEGFFKSDADATQLANERIQDAERQRLLVESIGQATGNLTIDEQYLNQVYSERLNLYRELYKEGLLTEEQLGELADEAAIKFYQQSRGIKKELTDVQKLSVSVGQTFAAGLSQSIVDFASGTKSAKEAFTDFARSFLMQVAQMILQMLILRALRSAFGFAAEGGTFMAASGGVFPRFMAAGGIQGVSEVSRPTYFPRFNVVAGEAGSEMLTVLAKPRMMEVGGMQAVVGNAGSNRLAITNANDLARGAGGSVQIHVSLDQGLRAEIVDQSIQGAVVTVTTEMGRDTKLRRAVKQVS
jgi:hypothetical protein